MQQRLQTLLQLLDATSPSPEPFLGYVSAAHARWVGASPALVQQLDPRWHVGGGGFVVMEEVGFCDHMTE